MNHKQIGLHRSLHSVEWRAPGYTYPPTAIGCVDYFSLTIRTLSVSIIRGMWGLVNTVENSESTLPRARACVDSSDLVTLPEAHCCC